MTRLSEMLIKGVDAGTTIMLLKIRKYEVQSSEESGKPLRQMHDRYLATPTLAAMINQCLCLVLSNCELG
jgi:hypothetical protein